MTKGMDIDPWSEIQNPNIEKNLTQKNGLGAAQQVDEEDGEWKKSYEPIEHVEEAQHPIVEPTQ
jgi:hypothetical protein